MNSLLNIKQLITITALGLSLSFFYSSCDDPENPTEMFTDSFDRGQMLVDWADLIIIPSFEAYQIDLLDLDQKQNNFALENNELNFEALRDSYLKAYLSWQKVSIFDIGKAEQIGLRNFTNIYPTDIDKIVDNISSGAYNLELPSNFVTQGFPALDFLLYGIGNTETEIRGKLAEQNYRKYLEDLIDRLVIITSDVVNDWKSEFRDLFINNDGASGTGSVDKMVNDFLFHYERFIRAGKIGIPAGVFSGNTMPESSEAPYSKIFSKQLFLASFNASRDFFSGIGFNITTSGQSLSSYLNHRMEETEGPDLTQEILDQWDIVEMKAMLLSDALYDQVVNDNVKMLETYDELQKAVIILKVDVMQSLNIQVDYVDADGD